MSVWRRAHGYAVKGLYLLTSRQLDPVDTLVFSKMYDLGRSVHEIFLKLMD